MIAAGCCVHLRIFLVVAKRHLFCGMMDLLIENPSDAAEFRCDIIISD